MTPAERVFPKTTERRSKARRLHGAAGLHPGGFNARRPRLPLCGDVNITPLIDVLLVLLIIFMAALPLTQRGLDIYLPAVVRAPSPPPVASTHIVAEYTADRRLSINKQPVALDDAERALRDLFAPRHDKTLYVIGDASVRYADILRILDAARGAGVTRIGIVTEGMRRAAF